MQRRSATKPRDGGDHVPDGWYRTTPEMQTAAVSGSSRNNAHPVTPPSASSASSSQRGTNGPDSLGLVKAVDPMRLLLRETRAKDKLVAKMTHKASCAATGVVPSGPGVSSSSDKERHSARSSPRHLKLVQQQANAPSPPGSGPAKSSFAISKVFSPQRSLRLASLSRRRPSVEEPKPPALVAGSPLPPSKDPASPLQPADRSVNLPLHELIQQVDDAVDADPFVDSNQAAVTQLFMAQWLAQFDTSRHQFKSIAVHAEVGFQELYRLTANLPSPNELLTSFTCRVLSDLAPHFGPYTPLIRVLHAELHVSAYSPEPPSLPYFAIVKNQKRLVLALRKDKKRRRERNAFLVHEIRQVHEMFRHFLDACSAGLVRTLFREWYSIAIIRKKNTKKYIEYFSAWFTGSAKSLVPKLFVTWKHEIVARKMDKMQAQLSVDGEKLAALQRQIDELSVQRDVAQVESLAIRNDRKQAEDMIQRLNRKIQSAGAYLEGSYRREGIVCQEGQLRVEAALFLPPLILESLLRGYHNVGFLQQLHNEFIPKPQEATNGSKPETGAALQRKPSTVVAEGGVAQRQSSVMDAESTAGATTQRGAASPATNPTVLQDCLAESIRLRGLSPPSASTQSQLAGEVSIQDFAKLFQSIQQRMDAKDVNVLFTRTVPVVTATTGGLRTGAIAVERAAQSDSDDKEDEEENDDDKPARLRQLAEQIANLYEQVLLSIRAQDEHYARNTKLFSSRMLESHEVSVVPHTNYLLAFNRPMALSTSDTESDKNSAELHSSSSPTTALTGGSLSLAPEPPAQSGDLGVINGTKRFSIANVCPIKMTPLQFDKLSIKTSSSMSSSCTTPVASNAALEQLAFIHWNDFSLSNRHTRAFVMLFLAHLASEFGSLLFSPADMSAFMHNAYTYTPSPPGTKVIENDRQGFQNLVTAYEVWNRLAAQMIEAEIAQSQGGTLALTAESVAPGSADSTSGGTDRVRRGSALLAAGGGGVLAIRPKLLLHIEPLPQGMLMTSAKEKEAGSTTNHGSTRLSLTLGETFHTARIRRLSLEDAQTLTQCVANIHRVVAATSTRLQDFNVMRQQLRDFRQLQWEQASDVASQFASQLTAVAPVQADPAVFTSSRLVDERKHVFECISFDNPVIERIFSIEENPHEELERVRGTLERKKHLVRHLYTKHHAHIAHAVSLDDLWHFVKVLRFPKEIHMLPAMRDEDMAANGFEQLFTPDDLAEILLQLCNEQFAPQIAPLSARVEYFARHHLPFAAQNQSIIRELMHEPDVKRALADHSQTIRIIFRRYCAKERELSGGSAAAAMHQQLHGGASTGAKANAHSQQPQHRAPVRHTSHGITKYMRLVDWLAFIQDYNLLRPRFPIDYAVIVFRNVQEAVAPSSNSSEAQDEQQLEMIYSEFCEALVGVAACFFPDPFLKSATKVSQFIQRFLPVSPEEATRSEAFASSRSVAVRFLGKQAYRGAYQSDEQAAHGSVRIISRTASSIQIPVVRLDLQDVAPSNQRVPTQSSSLWNSPRKTHARQPTDRPTSTTNSTLAQQHKMQVSTEKAPRTIQAVQNDSKGIDRFGASDEPLYGHPLMCANLPTQHFPQGSVPARVAHQLIKDELALDGNPKMNLASFVTTYMEPEADDLMVEGLRKNYIDLDQYPQTAEIHNRCVQILANLFHAPLEPGQQGTGTGCIGSSEAIMLAGLAMKRKWRDRRKAAGLAFDKPNMIFGSNVQVCWHKMCCYFEIEIREADVSPDCLVLTADRARPLIDENTIGVSAILGSTFNGEYENVKEIHDMLVEMNEANGWEVPLHVDAASGGFIAPFLNPELEWDFRLPNVKSINVSGHKFGLVYAGMGWALWREKSDLPEDLIFHVNYLGGDQQSFTLNFSKGAGNVIAQYYNILRFGFDGFRRIMEASMENAEYLRSSLVATGHFKIVDKQHMPLVAFTLIDSSRFTCFDIQDKLRSRGWIVPAYTCSRGAESLVIMRVVVKQNFAYHMVNMLVTDILKAIEALEKHYVLVETAMSSPKAKKMHFRNAVHSIQTNLQHQNSGETTHGVC